MLHHSAFKALLTRCLGQVPSRVLVALSGGVDSMCLTYLLAKYRDLYQPLLRIASVTIDHAYRPDSANEARAVGDIVSRWGVHHHVRRLQYQGEMSLISNFEEVAREKRYRNFLQLCRELDTNTLVVAHTLNDQIETYIQRMRGNSTIFGLAGLKTLSRIPLMEEVSPDLETIRVARPLLEYPKSSLIEFCKSNDVPWFEDSTNTDIHLTPRNMDRFLVNEYIPQKLKTSSECSLVSWNSLVQTHEQVVDLVKNIESRADTALAVWKHEQRLQLDERAGLMKLQLNFDEICDPLMLSRMLFRELYRVSSVNHYHWIYSRILNGLVPQIELVLERDVGTQRRTTIANLLVDLERTNHAVVMDISRQPIITKDITSISISTNTKSTESPWFLFDRRFWIRVHSQLPQNITIVPYSAKTHRKPLEKQFPEAEIPRKKADGVPIIIDSHQNLSLPTYGLVQPLLAVDWRLKRNVYRI